MSGYTIVDYDVALECGSHEALIRTAYKDSVGVWTWSVGLTSATGHKVERYIDNPQTLEHCLGVYAWALDNYAETVRAIFADTDLPKHAFAGSLSFHWNTGAITRASWVDHYKRGDMKAARKAFMQWSKAGGKVNQGLKKRRELEWNLIENGVWSNQGTMPEYTRLTSGYTPDWGSRVETDVSEALRIALSEQDTVAELEKANEQLSRKADKMEAVVKEESHFDKLRSTSFWSTVWSGIGGYLTGVGSAFKEFGGWFGGLEVPVQITMILVFAGLALVVFSLVKQYLDRQRKAKAAQEALE